MQPHIVQFSDDNAIDIGSLKLNGKKKTYATFQGLPLCELPEGCVFQLEFCPVTSRSAPHMDWQFIEHRYEVRIRDSKTLALIATLSDELSSFLAIAFKDELPSLPESVYHPKALEPLPDPPAYKGNKQETLNAIHKYHALLNAYKEFVQCQE